MSNEHAYASLHRTFSPKMTMYKSDGFGRDKYIRYDNGGYWKDNPKTIYKLNKYDVKKYSNFPSLKKNVPPNQYYSDGSGRDSYVIDCSGGLKKDYISNLDKFEDMLRNSKKPKSMNSDELSTKFKKFFLTKKEFSFNVHLSKFQKKLNDRLYYQHNDKSKAMTEPNHTVHNYNYKDSLRTYQILPDLSRNVNKIFDERYFKAKMPEKNSKLELNFCKQNTDMKLIKFKIDTLDTKN